MTPAAHAIQAPSIDTITAFAEDILEDRGRMLTMLRMVVKGAGSIEGDAQFYTIPITTVLAAEDLIRDIVSA